MASLDSIYDAVGTEYINTEALNIYDSPECKALATQAIAKRHLRIDASKRPESNSSAIPVMLVEDQYPGWLHPKDVTHLKETSARYQAVSMDRKDIEACLPRIIDYAKKAMSLSNEYLWGGTIGPNLDCSGLMQRAFGSMGIWLPRDAYQQEAFAEAIEVSLEANSLKEQLRPGDLVFFGTPQKATHVGLYLGQGEYIHSSGKEKGRNGIGINHLVNLTHPVSQNYAKEFRGAGRVMTSFCP